MRNQNKVFYREVQRPRQVWVWAIVLLVAMLFWYGFIQQVIVGIPFGDKPAPDLMLIILWVIFGLLFPLVMIAFLKLKIEVREDGVYVRFLPFHIRDRQFLFTDIEDYKMIDYSVLDYGGWGIRSNMVGGMAYTMSGKHGIQLTLNNKTVVIGTQRPSEFKKAIDELTDTF